MAQVMQFLSSINWAVVFAVLYGVCEALAHIQAVESNSVFQLLTKSLKFLYEKFGQKPAPELPPPADPKP